MKMTYKNCTFSVEESLIKDLKQLALDKDTSQKDLINKFIKEGLQRENSQTRLD